MDAMSRSDISIGQAAALYDVAPSTVRWWERQGVIPAPPRAGGRRAYTEEDLRRLGLAYLCCVTADIPLDRAATITAGSGNNAWQGVIRDQVVRIDEQIERLRASQEFLRHLLHCPDDDMAAECEYLDDELKAHTPRGRLAAPTLVEAARAARPATRPHRSRDENVASRDESDDRCAVCARPIVQPAKGRRRTYCSRACQQLRYRHKTRRTLPAPMTSARAATPPVT
jgi:MerR family copper efflux transcriptional regulator